MRFFIVLTIAALAVWLCLEVSVSMNWIENAPSFSVEIVILLFVSTLVIYYRLIRVQEHTFVQFYLLSMAVKILAYAAFNLLMVLRDKPGANANVLFFLLVYVLFTALEIAFLYQRFAASR